MKAFFALLLIGNIAFAIFQWLLPYEQLFVETRKVPAAEELQLLSEANSAIVEQDEVVASVEQAQKQAPAAVETPATTAEPEPAEPELLVTEDVRDKRVCYTIGPVKDKARAIEISGRYSGRQVRTTLKSSLEKQYLGMMVFIDNKSRAEALKTANRLSVKGIRDHIIINETGRPQHRLSLGVFGLKKNADRLQQRAQKLGFKAETEARYRERTIYWVYAEQSSEAELMRLLRAPEFEDGISQIPTQCLPS